MAIFNHIFLIKADLILHASALQTACNYFKRMKKPNIACRFLQTFSGGKGAFKHPQLLLPVRHGAPKRATTKP